MTEHRATESDHRLTSDTNAITGTVWWRCTCGGWATCDGRQVEQRHADHTTSSPGEDR